jgi:hypothetical protein
MITGTTAMQGTREMTDSKPAVHTERIEGESEEAYQERYAHEMKAADQYYTDRDKHGPFNPYAVPVAEKVFGEVLPGDSLLLSYEAVDGGVTVDTYGNAIDLGRRHLLTYADKAGTRHQLELLDKVAYTALDMNERQSQQFGTFTSAINTVFYIRNSNQNISAKPGNMRERKPAHIVTNIGKGK